MNRRHAVSILLTGMLAPVSVAWGQANFWKPDVGVFAGTQDFKHWRNRIAAPGSDMVGGGLFGARVGWDLSRRWGFETSYTYAVNNLRLFPVPAGQLTSTGPDSIGYGARNHHLAVNPLFHFLDRNARIRPYVTAGLGILWFEPTSEAQRSAQSPQAPVGASVLDGRYGPAFNWGGGLKFNLTRMFEMRVDARNIISQAPHFALPASPLSPGGVYIARRGAQSGFQITGGVGVRTRGGEWIKSADRQISVMIEGDRSTLASGARRDLVARTNLPPDTPVKFTWSVDGQSMDTAGPNFTFSSGAPGAHKICVSATAKDYSTGSDCANIVVTGSAASKFNVSLSANPEQTAPGQSSKITATTDLPAGVTPTYEWTVNGDRQSETGPIFTFDSAGRAPGVYEICARVTAPGYAESRQCTKVEIRDCGEPAVRAAGAATQEIFSSESATLLFQTQPNACGATPKLSYRTTEGTVTPTNGGVLFNSNGVGFNMSDRSRLQRKTVTVTATATDDQGRTATAQSTVVVKLAPVAQRLDDVIFAAGDTRVNNCGKRLLLELVAPKLQQDPRAKVVLVGHMDANESRASSRGRRRSRAAVALDRERVLNAAAVISAGSGICPAMELNRVLVGFAGTGQKSKTMPAFCGTSTERRGSRVSATDPRAPFRRVEVWIVPEGAAMPADAGTVSAAPASAIQAKGCPK
ncbi:MAG: outer membrane beta-barrel protein [Bryobacteraceae bacterium]